MSLNHICQSCGIQFGFVILEHRETPTQLDSSSSSNPDPTAGNSSRLLKLAIQEHCVRVPFNIHCGRNHYMCNFCVAQKLREYNKKTSPGSLKPFYIKCELCKFPVSHERSPEPDPSLFMVCALKKSERTQFEIERILNQLNTSQYKQTYRKQIEEGFQALVVRCLVCEGSTPINRQKKQQPEIESHSTSARGRIIHALRKEPGPYCHSNFKVNHGQANCETGPAASQIQFATVFCQNCRLVCCESCHNQLNCPSNRRERICDVHKKERNIYCIEHREFVCPQCFVKDPVHKKHIFHNHMIFLSKQEADNALFQGMKELRKLESTIREQLGSTTDRLAFLADSSKEPQFNYSEMRIRDAQKNRLEQASMVLNETLKHLQYFTEKQNSFKFISYSTQKTTNQSLEKYLAETIATVKLSIKSVAPDDSNEKSLAFDSLSGTRFCGLDNVARDLALSLLAFPTAPSSPTTPTAVASPKPIFLSPGNNSLEFMEEKKSPSRSKPALLKSISEAPNGRAQTPLNRTSSIPKFHRRAADNLDHSLEINENDLLQVVDAEVVNPGEFYVQIKRREFMMDRLKSLFQSYGPKLSRLDETDRAGIRVGEMYLCFYGRLPKRCRIEETSDENRDLLVFLIDEGRRVRVDPSHLTYLPGELKVIPGLAVKCFLANLKPYDSQIGDFECAEDTFKREIKLEYMWNEAARALLNDWIRSYSSISVKIIKKIPDEDWYGVDLVFDLEKQMEIGNYQTKETKKLIESYKIEKLSVCEAFVKSKLAKYEFVQETSKSRMRAPEPHRFQSMPITGMFMAESFQAEMANYENIDGFYLRFYEDNSFSELSKKLHDEYANMKYTNLMRVFAPEEGMPIAALYDDNVWYRGEIVEIIPNTAQFVVMFVDYGNHQTLTGEKIRYLKPQYSENCIPTFRCKLFGIEFVDDECKNQSEQIVWNGLDQLVNQSNQLVQVHVKNFTDEYPSELIKSILNKRTYEIVLRFPIDDKLTNINLMLTKMALAECVDSGIYDGEGTAMTSSISTSNVVMSESPQTVHFNVPKNALTRHGQQQQQQKLSPKLENDVRSVLTQPRKMLSERPTNSSLFYVTSAYSPSEIWMQDIVDADKWYAEFQDQLFRGYMELYEKDEMRGHDWQPKDLCVLMKKKPAYWTHEFYRAQIVHQNQNQKYKLLLLDAGRYEDNVDESCILKLIDEYRTKHKFKAKQYYIGGVEPMGTSNGQWSSQARKYTAEALNDQKVLVVIDWKKKTDENEPSEAHIYLEIKKKSSMPGPLDEVKMVKEYVRFADLLNIKGLAFLDEKKRPVEKLMVPRTN